MLYNLIFITVFGIVWGSLILVSYRSGYKDGKEVARPIDENIRLPSSDKGDIKKPAINPVQQKERERFSRLLENIDNYDGTGMGQKEV